MPNATPPPNLEPLLATVLHHTRAHLRAVLALQRARHLDPNVQDDPETVKACQAHFAALWRAKCALTAANLK